MCETFSELDLTSLINCDQLELGGTDMEMEFPDIFNDILTAPDMSKDFLSYSEPHEIFVTFPEVFRIEISDLSNSQSDVVPEQRHLNQIDWGTQDAPIITTNPDQFDCLDLNITPTGYESHQFHDTRFVNGRKRRAVGQPRELDLGIDNEFLGDHMQTGKKPKRKRVQNARQRKEANVRERKRILHFNQAFDKLKTKVPTFTCEKQLSRMETLKLAMSYISFMTQLLDGKKPDDISVKENSLNSLILADLEIPSSTYFSNGMKHSQSNSTWL